MDVFVARQPIFDVKLDTFAYELLFRDSLENYFPEIDGNTASGVGSPEVGTGDGGGSAGGLSEGRLCI
jgi:hypothetical protein